jgi:hypothetical protein
MLPTAQETLLQQPVLEQEPQEQAHVWPQAQVGVLPQVQP